MPSRPLALLYASLATLTASACSTPDPAPTTNSPVNPAVNPAVSPVQRAALQVKRGATVYGEHCARCHGAAGEGSPEAPPVVGAGALPLHAQGAKLRTGPFRTALDVAQFATSAMPPGQRARSRMEEADYWAVLAFALSANGVELRQPVDASSAAGIVLHP